MSTLMLSLLVWLGWAFVAFLIITCWRGVLLLAAVCWDSLRARVRPDSCGAAGRIHEHLTLSREVTDEDLHRWLGDKA